ncbi:MAG: ABC transporter permease subunit [Chitinophagaceae bacterium]|nr:ABC transporter permease subunit [Chitinophagaceae bacterium]MCW5928900.1 ABC transporter permease subunit [Chitinophagaceae bacterium]
MKNIFTYEWKLFIRNKTMPATWLLMFGIGLYALYYGRSFSDTQLDTITKIDTAYQARIQTQLQRFSADTTTKEGMSDYRNVHDAYMNEWYTRPMVWKQPEGLQALSLGQSDNQPFYYNLWIYNNVYNTRQPELRNPDKLLAGNFDLSFVIIYLLPLLIIAYSYNVVSADRENGLAGLLNVQGVSQRAIVSGRLLFRCCTVLVLALLLSIIGIIINGVAMGAAAGWLGVNVLYILFWFSLVYWLTASGQSGAVTAVKLVSLWVVLLIMIPSLFNSLQKINEDAKMEIAEASREYGGKIWDMDKQLLADTFLLVKPEWKEYFILKNDTNDLRSVAYTYFTVYNMNRVGRGIDSAALQQQSRLERFNYVNPVFATQLLYNKLAATELNNFIVFREAASAYQQQRYELIAQKELSGEKLTPASFQAYPKFVQPVTGLTAGDWFRSMIPVMCFMLIALLLGNYYWKNNAHKK